MKKIIFVLLMLPVFLNHNILKSQETEEAKVTIVLTDRDGTPKANLDFDLLNTDKSLKEKCKTNDSGEYRTSLKKGATYIVFFTQETKEWRFNLDVPAKPGPRSYKFTFKVFIETKNEVVYKSSSVFSTKKDPTVSEVTIALRDQSGMGLPEQTFTVSADNGSFSKKAATDSSGIYQILLKKGEKYNVETDVEGHLFNTYFNIGKEVDILTFHFDIDFEKITHIIIDTAGTDNNPGENELKTTIKVINQKGEIEEGAEVVLEESNKREFSGTTDNLGTVLTKSDRRKVYEVFVRKYGKTYSYEVVLPKDKNIKEYEFVAKVDYSDTQKRKFKLNVHFDSGKFDIRKESFPEIDAFLEAFKVNPKLVVEIGGHTDNVGAEDMNQKLSENRAKAIVDCMIAKGIDSSKLKYKGYGENQPCATNKTAQGRQLNRRIEVTVLAE
jgi:outer membrane protein OmpA-like peptidoglycan-associated protein